MQARLKIGVLAAFAALAVPLAAEERVVYEADSLYHHIVVSQTEAVRILRFQKGPAHRALGSSFAQSVISLEDPYELYMTYAKYCMAGAAFAENPRKALFVGLGAGSLPKFFARAFPQCRVDVAELDEKVVHVARRFFFLPELPNMNIEVMDGRIFLRRSKDVYDLIVLDAYRDQMIPFHLMTRDFFEEIKRKLSPQGVLVSNLAVEDRSQLYPWVLRTYQDSFGTVFRSRVPGSINKVLAAWATPAASTEEDFVRKSQALAQKVNLGFDISECAAGYKDVSSKSPTKKVLTDDYAPVNLMRIRRADEEDWEY